MRVVLVHNSYQQPGGEDIVFARERDLLRAAGHSVLEYVRSNNEIEDYSIVRRLSLLGRTIWAADSLRDFTVLLQENRPDIVHVHNTFPLISPAIYSACRDAQVPVVQTLHNYRLLCPGSNFFRDGRPCEDCLTGGLWQGAVHGCYRNSHLESAAVALMLAIHRARKTWTELVDAYIVLSAFSRSRFVQAGLPDELIKVKPNFVHCDPGKRQGNGSYVLFVGRLDREKGVPTLLKAWQQLPRDMSLQIVGEGPARNELMAMVKGCSNVSFTGWLSNEQVFCAMKQARVLVFASEWYENSPLTIIEAFACGLPVIASNLGAMPELVEHGRNGLLFDPGNADHLARTILEAWQQPEYMQRLGDHAREDYEKKYSSAANYRQLMDIYEHVLANRVNVQDLCPSQVTVALDAASGEEAPVPAGRLCKVTPATTLPSTH
jgi:glycosyltransferase involved in cell wall biosynthesis